MPRRRTTRENLITARHSSSVVHDVGRAVAWYFTDHREHLPFYCDPNRVGAFAVDRDHLAAGDDAAIFGVFVTLSMYQALRDVVIMRQQRLTPGPSVQVVADLDFVKTNVARHECGVLQSAEAFEQSCNVGKVGGRVDCDWRSGARCHVKDATVVFNRMGDMGKLPTSAWLRIWKPGGVKHLLTDVCRDETSPKKRAAVLVERFATVHRVGRKLATMFVSALSTPALAPGLTPWFPEVDGNELVVVDTNVARAVDLLRDPGAPRTYDARERWLREQAARIDLREFGSHLPRHSPRLVQQALYAFCSRSNRVAHGDSCAERGIPCAGCAKTLCPFVARTEGKAESAAASKGGVSRFAADVGMIPKKRATPTCKTTHAGDPIATTPVARG